MSEYKIVDEMIYRSYRAQRLYYKIPAEKLAPIFDQSKKYEQRLKNETRGPISN